MFLRFFFLATLLAGVPALAQSDLTFEVGDPVTIELVSADDRLTGVTTVGVQQDSLGYLWVANLDGIFRFDGSTADQVPVPPRYWSDVVLHEHTIYATGTAGPDPTDSLSSVIFIIDTVHGDTSSIALPVVRDADGTKHTFLPWKLAPAGHSVIWCLAFDVDDPSIPSRAEAKRTLLRIDLETRTVVGQTPESRADGWPEDPTTLLVDQAGHTWVGTESSGLFRFDPSSGAFEQFTHVPTDANSLGAGAVRFIYEAPGQRGVLWVGTGRSPLESDLNEHTDTGLNRIDSQTGRIERFRHDTSDETSLAHDRVFAIQEASNRELWVATAGGLQVLDDAQRTFRRVAIPGVERGMEFEAAILSVGHSSAVLAHLILRDPFTGELQRQIVLFQPDLGAAYPLPHSELGFAMLNLLSPDSPMTAAPSFEDWFGSIWVPSRVGLFRVPAPRPLIRFAGVSADASRRIRSLAPSPGGGLLVGYYEGGLEVRDRDGSTVRQLRSAAGQGLYDDNIGAINRSTTASDTYWLGTGAHNDWASRGAVQRFSVNGRPEAPITFPAEHGGQRVQALYEESPDRLWVGTTERLYLVNPVTRAIQEVVNADGDAVGRTKGIAPIDDGRLLIGGTQDLLLVDTATLTAVPVHSMGFGQVNAVFRADDGRVWVGADEGLYIASIADGDFTIQTVTGPSESVSIQHILQDLDGHLWASANTTFSQQGTGWILHVDPGDLSATLFRSSIDLPSDIVFTPPGGAVTDDGRIHFGGYSGIYSFDPTQLRGHSIPPPSLVITHIQVERGTQEAGDGRSQQDPPELARSVRLGGGQSDLRIEFQGIHSAEPTGLQYAYRLDGYDNDWRDGDTRGIAEYFRLDPGTYTFRARAAGTRGVWSEERTLTVEVLPPWWRTRLAFALYGFALIGFVVGGTRVQRARVVEKERRRLRDRELEQAREIEKAYRELETTHQSLKATQAQLVQSEKLASLGQLTAGIAHEIQNPLNFVNNFAGLSSELLKDLKDEIRMVADEVASDPESELSRLLVGLELNAAQIAKHGGRADAIVKSMMEHARIGKGQRYEVGVNDLVEEYVSLSYHGMKARLPGLDIDIALELDPATGTHRLAPQEIGRALQNVLNNAFEVLYDYRPEGVSSPSDEPADETFRPRVRVSTNRTDRGVEIRIADNGPGIPEDVRDTIFEPFFTTKPTGQGTGLGLSLAYEIIVDGHGGALTVDSEPGRGATFVFELPESGA